MVEKSKNNILICTEFGDNTNAFNTNNTPDELTDNVGGLFDGNQSGGMNMMDFVMMDAVMDGGCGRRNNGLLDVMIIGSAMNQQQQQVNPYGYGPRPMMMAQPMPHGQQPMMMAQPVPYGQQPMMAQPVPYGQQPMMMAQPVPYGQQSPYGSPLQQPQTAVMQQQSASSREVKSVNTNISDASPKQSAVHPPAQPAAKKSQSSNEEFIFTDSESGLKQKRTLKSMQQQKDDSTFIPTLSGENYSQNSNKVDNRSRSGCGCNII